MYKYSADEVGLLKLAKRKKRCQSRHVVPSQAHRQTMLRGGESYPKVKGGGTTPGTGSWMEYILHRVIE